MSAIPGMCNMNCTEPRTGKLTEADFKPVRWLSDAELAAMLQPVSLPDLLLSKGSMAGPYRTLHPRTRSPWYVRIIRWLWLRGLK